MVVGEPGAFVQGATAADPSMSNVSPMHRYTVYPYRPDLKVAITTVLPIATGQDLLFCQQ